MSTITIVGLGPGPLGQLTKEAEVELLTAEKIFFRISYHPVYEWLEKQGKHVWCFDQLYKVHWKQGVDIYEFIVSVLLKEAELRGKVTYALPGSHALLEYTTRSLRKRGTAAGVQVRLIHGLSFLEEALGLLNFDILAEGLQLVVPQHLKTRRFTTDLALLVCQIEAKKKPTDQPRVDLTVEWLLKAFPPEHPVTLIWTDGLPEYKTQTRAMKLNDLVQEYRSVKSFASLYVPPLRAPRGVSVSGREQENCGQRGSSI